MNKANTNLVVLTILIYIIIVVVGLTSLSGSLVLPHGPTEWFGFFLFMVSLFILWAILAYYLASIFFRITRRLENNEVRGISEKVSSSVAVLLCTRDDWVPSVAFSCIKALNIGDHLFICDDSQSDEFKRKSAEFSRKNTDKCTVIRRDSLRGWKAGNINNCLKILSDNYKYFLVADHDNPISRDMIKKGLSLFLCDDKLAFVQFPNVEDEKQCSSKFSQDLITTVRATWWILSLRARYGFRFNVGHSVMFRFEAIQSVGGFPENILTEDIALSMLLMNHGYKSAYDLSFSGKESIPDTYKRFRSRYCRWCIGTLQSWLDPSTRFSLKKNCAHVVLDAALVTVNLLFAVPMVMLFAGLWLFSSEVTRSVLDSGLMFKFIVVLSLVTPNVPLFITNRTVFKGIKSASIHTAIYLSLVIPVTVSLLWFLVSGQAEFINTGNKIKKKQTTRESVYLNLFSANGPGTIVIEVLLFSLMLLNSASLELFGMMIMSALFCGILFNLLPWESRIVSVLKYIPIIFLVTASISLFLRF